MSALFSLPASPRHDATIPTVRSTTLYLSAGQHLWLQLPPSTHVQLDQGELELQLPPTWLADSMHQPRLRLHAGQGHWLPEGGWVLLQATGACTLGCHSVVAPTGRLRRWLQRGAKLVRRCPGLGRVVPVFCG